MGRLRRESSIHITRNKLEEIVEDLENLNLISINFPKGSSKKIFWDEVLRRASLNPLNNRMILVSNKTMEKKVNRVLLSNKVDTLLFSKILHTVRANMKHRGIKMIIENTKEWGILKTVSSNATTFSNDFDLSLKEGYTQYIKMGIKRMSRFALNRFIGLHDIICEAFSAIIEINRDKFSTITEILYKEYMNKIFEKTSLSFDYKDQPEKLVFFTRAAELVVELGITGEDFIKGQFESMSFFDGIPDPSQLVGSKAKERIIKYMYENNINIKIETNENNIDFSQIKKLK